METVSTNRRRKDSSAFLTGILYFIQNKRSFVGYAGKFAVESGF
jgi:hypothetical protein